LRASAGARSVGVRWRCTIVLYPSSATRRLRGHRRSTIFRRATVPTTENAPPGRRGAIWGYYREERYVSLYMLIRGR
jgi:hypothetical protein